MSINQEKFKEMLKEKGLKVTNQRLVVLKVLAEHKDRHMTAEEIYDLVRNEFRDIGIATVYRTVQLLLEMKLIDRIELNDGYVRYEIGHQFFYDTKHYHHHLICKECGKVISFDDDLLEDLEKHIEETLGFCVLDHELKLYGKCKDCIEKEKNVRKHIE